AEERGATRDEGDGHRLPAAEPRVAVDAAVLARRDVEAELVLVVDHDAIAAEVDPAVVGVPRDVEAAGADVAAAVALVPFRRGEDRHLDLRPALHFLEDGTVLHIYRRDRRDAFCCAPPPRADEALPRRLRID